MDKFDKPTTAFYRQEIFTTEELARALTEPIDADLSGNAGLMHIQRENYSARFEANLRDIELSTQKKLLPCQQNWRGERTYLRTEVIKWIVKSRDIHQQFELPRDPTPPTRLYESGQKKGQERGRKKKSDKVFEQEMRSLLENQEKYEKEIADYEEQKRLAYIPPEWMTEAEMLLQQKDAQRHSGIENRQDQIEKREVQEIARLLLEEDKNYKEKDEDPLSLAHLASLVTRICRTTRTSETIEGWIKEIRPDLTEKASGGRPTGKEKERIEKRKDYLFNWYHSRKTPSHPD